MRPASLSIVTVADGPHPPLVDRTRGVKVKTGDIYVHAQTVCTGPLLGGEGPGDEAISPTDLSMAALAITVS